MELREILLWDAGIYNSTPHSFRGASSSAVLKRGIPVEEILRRAGWSNETTFRKFYNRPVDKNSVSKKSTHTELYSRILKYFEKKN